MLKILEITEQDIQIIQDRLRAMQDSWGLEANVHDHSGKLGADCCGIGFIVDGAMQNKSGMSSTYKLVNSNDDFDEELQMAMALSLSSSHDSSEKKRKFIDVDNNDNNNDADFQKALILSRQSQQEEKDLADALRLSLQPQTKKCKN